MKKDEDEFSTLFSTSGLFPSAQKDSIDSNSWIKNSSFKTIGQSFHASSSLFSSKKSSPDLIASTSNATDTLTVGKDSQKKEKDHERARHKNKLDPNRTRKQEKKEEKEEKRRKKKNDSHSSIQNYGLLYPKAIFIEDTPLKPDQAFRLDRKQDLNNICYDSLYSNQIPSYWKPKSCLNLNEPNKKPRVQRYFGKKSKLKKSTTQIVRQMGGISSASLPFIPLTESSDSSLKERKDDFYSTVFDTGTIAYSRGEAKPTKAEKSCEVFDDKIDYFGQQLLFERIKKYNRHLNENPGCVSKWIEFVRLQSQMHSQLTPLDDDGKSGNQKADLSTKKGNEKLIEDRQISILDKALKHNPGNFELLMERLQVQQCLLDPNKLNEQWKQLVFRFPNQINVWLRYFEFVLSNVAYFSITKLARLFQQCITKLVQLQQEQMKSHQMPENIVDSMLKMVFLYTTILDQSGYTERSTAIWQALIEFNLFTPTHLGSNVGLTDLMDYFEPFWESGAPRFGESNALGWSQMMKNRVVNANSVQAFHLEEKQLSRIENRLIKSLDENQPMAKSWLQFELTRQSFCWIPVKPSMAEECDDSVRAVQFDEIKSALFSLTSVDDKVLMLKYFFRHLKAMPFENDLNVISVMDIGLTCLSTEDLENTCKLKDYTFCRDRFRFIQNVFEQSIRLFADDLKTVQTLTLQMIEFISSTQLTFDSTKMRKVMRNELKQQRNRNNLDLWHAFCRFEQKFSGHSNALNTFELVLSSFVSQGLLGQVQNLSRFVRMALEMEQPAKFDFASRFESIPVQSVQILVRVICSFANQKHYTKPEDITSAVLVKTFHTFEETDVNSTFHDALDLLLINGVFCIILQSNATHFPVYTEAILSKVEKVVDRLNNFAKKIGQANNEKSIEQNKNQLFHVFKTVLEVQLLNFRCHQCSLLPIKESLDEAMRCLPNEPEFLELFVRLELGSALSFKARRFITQLYELGPASHVYQWIYVIVFELKRLERLQQGEQQWAALQGNCPTINGALYSVGVANRMRALFEHAIQAGECVLLWRMYIAFEISQSNFNQAKSVFYRALQRCPWSKNLYLDAINAFSATRSTLPADDLTPENVSAQLEELVSLMQEKEIRVRTLLEEIRMLTEHRADLLITDEID